MDGGIIPLWKDKGILSQTCVSKIRRWLKTKKVGHAGTLDPDVDGVLPIAFGKGTKVLEYMLDADKSYDGQLTLGWSTTTEDRSGEQLDRVALGPKDISLQDLDVVLQDMQGTIQQTPPMYSAVKIEGKRLYDFARQGIEIDRPSRPVTIYELKRTSDFIHDPASQSIAVDFRVRCSKGTYIRTLTVDIGKALGMPAHMSRLTRIESAGIHVDQCLTLDQLKQVHEKGKLTDWVLPLEDCLKDFTFIPLSDDLRQRVNHGSQLRQDNFDLQDLTEPVVLTYEGQAQAIYHPHPQRPGWLKPLKMIR